MSYFSTCVRSSMGGATIQIQSTEDIGIYSAGAEATVGRQRLPTESIGVVTLSFTGTKIGSEIQIFDIFRNPLSGTDTSTAVPSFSLPIYSAGASRNIVRILILSLGNEVIDFNYTLVGNAIIPVFQRIDRNYSNPT